MRFYRFFPVFLTAAGLCLLTGALKMKGPTADRAGPDRLPADGLGSAPINEQAVAALDEALARLRVRWLETGIRLQVRLPGLAYQAHGRYLLAPGQRFRLELTTRPQEGP